MTEQISKNILFIEKSNQNSILMLSNIFEHGGVICGYEKLCHAKIVQGNVIYKCMEYGIIRKS